MKNSTIHDSGHIHNWINVYVTLKLQGSLFSAIDSTKNDYDRIRQLSEYLC